MDLAVNMGIDNRYLLLINHQPKVDFCTYLTENNQHSFNWNIKVFWKNIEYFSQIMRSSSLTEGKPSGHVTTWGFPAIFSTFEFANIGACLKFTGVVSIFMNFEKSISWNMELTVKNFTKNDQRSTTESDCQLTYKNHQNFVRNNTSFRKLKNLQDLCWHFFTLLVDHKQIHHSMIEPVFLWKN